MGLKGTVFSTGKAGVCWTVTEELIIPLSVPTAHPSVRVYVVCIRVCVFTSGDTLGGAHVFTCMWRPQVNIKCLPHLLFTSLRQGLSIEPRAHRSAIVDYQLALGISQSCLSTSGITGICSAFTGVQGIQTLIFKLVLYPLGHLLIPAHVFCF